MSVRPYVCFRKLQFTIKAIEESRFEEIPIRVTILLWQEEEDTFWNFITFCVICNICMLRFSCTNWRFTIFKIQRKQKLQIQYVNKSLCKTFWKQINGSGLHFVHNSKSTENHWCDMRKIYRSYKSIDIRLLDILLVVWGGRQVKGGDHRAGGKDEGLRRTRIGWGMPLRKFLMHTYERLINDLWVTYKWAISHL